MTEQRSTDWKGPVALVLAALALLVALSGRALPFDGPPTMSFRVEAAPVPVQPPVPPAAPEVPKDPGGMYGMTDPMPMMPDEQRLRDELRQMWREIWGDMKGMPFDPALPMKPAEPMAPMAPMKPMPPKGDNYFDGGGRFDDGGNVFAKGLGYLHDVYSYVQPLLQLALVVLIGVILFSWLRRRNRPANTAGYYPGYAPPPGYPPQQQAPPPAQGQGNGNGNDTPPTGYPGPGVLD